MSQQLQNTPTLDTHGLTGLGYLILMDRYALKKRGEANEGDLVIAIINNDGKDMGQKRELGFVTGRDGDTVSVKLVTSEEIIDLPLALIEKPLETNPKEIMERVAKGIASAETTSEKQKEWQEKFEWLLDDWKFVPGGRILTAAGTNQELSFYNCFVVPSPHDSRGGIMKTLTQMTEIMSRGGGVGINISTLRPQNAQVMGVNGRSSGSVSWGGLYSFVTGLIEQGGSRRGALILILNDWHPDVFKFIESKRTSGKITNANISVGISDKFMSILKEDGMWQLKFPDTKFTAYNSEWTGDLEEWEAKGYPVVIHQEVKASEIWDAIIESAHASAEPGLWFRERSNKMANSYYYPQGKLISTNPCGEIPLAAWAVCNLGAINLGKMYNKEVQGLDEELLRKTIEYATRFLDNVIDKTPYFIQENEIQQKSERKIGLGIMGLAELLIKMKVRYGSDKGAILTNRIFKIIAEEAYLTSSKIAAEKGSFPLYDEEGFMGSGYMQHMIQHGSTEVIASILENGMRNVTLLTVAPTGCIAPDTLISANDSLLKISNMGDINGNQWQDIDASVMTDEGLKESNKFYINGKQPVKKIITKRGFSITATHNHRIRVIDEITGEYLWRRMDEIKENDTVVLWRNTLKGNPEIELKQLSKTKHHNAIADMPKTLTPAFARLLGLYIGDGYIKAKGGLNIVVNNEDIDVIEKIRIDAKKVFNTEIHIEQRIGCKVVTINSRDMIRFFELNGLLKPKGNYGQGARGAFIPDIVLQSGRMCLSAFISGLFDSDGSINRGTVSLASTSETLIKQTQISLLALGIASNIEIHRDRSDSYGKNPLYSLRLVNMDEVQLFKKEIGFISNRKNARLSTDMVKSARGDTIRVQAAINEFYKSSEGLPTVIRQQINWSVGNGSMNLEFVREKTKTHSQLKQSVIGRLALRGAFFDTIQTIENGECSTYDISVPEGNTYIANGFVSHNTTGTLVNTSTGIEPYFSWVYYRKGRLGIHEEKALIVQDWLKEQNISENSAYALPNEFVTAMELTPKEHVIMQAAAQKWVDNSLSKTINAPHDYTIEQTKELYQMLYDSGCKGGTIYRDGSRDEQVLTLKKDGDNNDNKTMITTETTSISSSANFIQVEPIVNVPYIVTTGSTVSAVVPINSKGLVIEKRGAHLAGQTFKGVTPYGNVLITVNEDVNGNPVEVLIMIAKSGSDLAAQAESTGRLMSASLQMQASENRLAALKEFVQQIRGIGGSRQVGFGINRVTSFPDAVAKIIEDQYIKPHEIEMEAAGYTSAPIQIEDKGVPDVPVYSSVTPSGVVESTPIVLDPSISANLVTTSVTTPNGQSYNISVNGHSKAPIKMGFADLCPECQNQTLLRQDGCKKCEICGYSEC